VWDSDATLPIREQHSRGRGLDSHLLAVEEMSQRWDCYRPRSGGKVIWAELTAPSSRPRGPRDSLPVLRRIGQW
jgi:D-alanyl-D-alanine dipeptidase